MAAYYFLISVFLSLFNQIPAVVPLDFQLSNIIYNSVINLLVYKLLFTSLINPDINCDCPGEMVSKPPIPKPKEAQDVLKLSATWSGTGPLAPSALGVTSPWVLGQVPLDMELHSHKAVMCLEDVTEDFGVLGWGCSVVLSLPPLSVPPRPFLPFPYAELRPCLWQAWGHLTPRPLRVASPSTQALIKTFFFP